MAFPRKSIIPISILAILIALVATGYFFYNKGPVDIKKATAQKITAAELYDAFVHDTISAAQKYSGKILLVSGTVSQVDKNQQEQIILLLKTGSGGGFLNCTLETTEAVSVREGQPVSLKGFCSGLGEVDETMGLQPDLYIERCIIQQ